MKKSAGILLYRIKEQLEIMLIHPGGPFWAKKDMWSIPKGEINDDEDPFSAALREFSEETGFSLKPKSVIALSPLKMKSGKIIYAWGIEGNIDVSKIKSNTFEIEWPPKSGKIVAFPEADMGAWFNTADAKSKIHASQLSFIDELILLLKNV